MTDQPNDRVDDAVDQFLRYLEDGMTRPSLAGLTAVEQREAEKIFRLLEACWGANVPVAPPLEEDPIAIELGLVPVQPPTVTIDGRIAKRLRLQRNLQLQHVADTLSQGGHAIALQWLLRMEQTSSMEVDRGFAAELARILGAPIGRILADSPPSDHCGLAAYFRTGRFAEQIARWARSRNLEVAAMKLQVERALTMAPARSRGRPSDDDCARLVDAYLRSLVP